MGSGAMMTRALFAVSAWMVAPPALNDAPFAPPAPNDPPFAPPVAGPYGAPEGAVEVVDVLALSGVGADNCSELPPLSPPPPPRTARSVWATCSASAFLR